MFKIFKKLMCKHEWKLNGWSTVKCKHCDYVEDNPKIVDDFVHNFFKSRIVEGHPALDADAWNKVLNKRGIYV